MRLLQHGGPASFLFRQAERKVVRRGKTSVLATKPKVTTIHLLGSLLCELPA